jgi:hypothetical protein
LSFGLGIDCPFLCLGERLQGNAQKHQRPHSGKRERTTSVYCVHFLWSLFLRFGRFKNFGGPKVR